ncbi:MAG: hypothetical protein JWP89_5157 [Schlesneria sp.]|nr:hypothetical protein [Schlesneria sp.]
MHRLYALLRYCAIAGALMFLPSPWLYGADRSPVNTVSEFVGAIRASRDKLAAGTFMIDAVCPVVTPNYLQYGVATRRYEVALLSEKGYRRFAMHWQHPQSTWTAKTLVKGDQVFLDPGEWAPHANYGTINGAENYGRFVFDPLLLGIECRTLLELQRSSLDLTLSRMLAGEGGSLSLDDDESITMQYSIGKRLFTVTAAPALDYGVTRASVKSPADTFESVETQYTRVPGDEQSWYPSKISYKRLENNAIVFEEDLTITFQRNPDLSDKDFTIEALGLSDGRRIISEDVKAMVWRDGIVKQATGADVVDPGNKGVYLPRDNSNALTNQQHSTDLPKADRFKLVLIVNCVIAVAVAMVLVIRMWMQRRSK